MSVTINENVQTAAPTIIPDPVDTINVDRNVIDNYEKTIAELRAEVNARVPMKLTFQQLIEQPPITREQMYEQSCSNDSVTVKFWRDKWVGHTRENMELYDFREHSSMKSFAKYACRPVVVAGSGPSLKKNAHHLKDKNENIGLVSCLHNFAYFIDNEIKCDGYINMDAGDITIPEMSQGGKHPEQYYWDASKDQTLIAASVTKPELIKRWQGDIQFFQAPIPDQAIMKEIWEITKGFGVFYNVGGNALGATYYHARAILGGMPIAMIGADFAFDYMHKFHSWDSPYDKQFDGVVPCTDIFGNRVYTWPSYLNFSKWFLSQAMGGNGNNPMIMINCTEGGVLGAFPHGNVKHVHQMALVDFLHMYNHYTRKPEMVENPPDQPKLLF